MKSQYLKFLFVALLSSAISAGFAQATGTECGDAIPISEGIFTADIVPNNSAFVGFCYEGDYNTVWYEYTPSETGLVTINSGIDPDLIDTRLSAFAGPCDDLSCIGSDDDGGDVFTSLLSLEVEAGNPIYLQWDDRWSGDSFDFEVGFGYSPEDVYGCTDSEAINFDPYATIDDGSCEYIVLECDFNLLYVTLSGGGFTNEISWAILDEEGEVYAEGGYFNANTGSTSSPVCLMDGCYSFVMLDSWGDGWGNAEATISLASSGDIVGVFTLEEGDISNETFGINVDECEDIELEIPGCTDPEALNYSENATMDDGSCIYPFSCEEGVPAQLYICAFSNGDQVNIDVSGSNGVNVFSQEGFQDFEIMTLDICLEEGICYTVNMENNEGPYGWYGGYYWINVDGLLVSTGMLEQGEQLATEIFSIDGTCGEVYGCTDVEAENYNPEATEDDGSCTYFIANDHCSEAQSLVAGATISINNIGADSDGYYGDCWGFGNGEAEQNGIWFSFITPSDPAVIIIEASNDGTFSLTDTQFGLFEDCGGGEEMLYCDGNSGDGLFSRFEFPCGSLLPNTEYFLLVDGWAGQQGTCLLYYGVSEECESVEGCMDPEALNYNEEATMDDGSCIYPLECDDNLLVLEFEEGQWLAEVAWYIAPLDDSDVIIVEGGVSPEPELICLPDGCYQLIMIDTFGDGWNGNILNLSYNGVTLLETTLEEGNYGVAYFGVNSECEDLEVFGCTDPLALNYNPFATIDDGSCISDPIFDTCQASFEVINVNENEDVVYILNTSSFGWGYEYLWDFGDGSTSTAPLPIHVYAEDGTYTICLTVTSEDCEAVYCDEITYEVGGIVTPGNGQGINNNGFTINVVSTGVTGVGEIKDEDVAMTVYPNPTADVINIAYDASRGSEITLAVLDMAGNTIWSEKRSTSLGNNIHTIAVESLAPGIYMLEVRMNDRVQYKRFSVLR